MWDYIVFKHFSIIYFFMFSWPVSTNQIIFHVIGTKSFFPENFLGNDLVFENYAEITDL